MLSYITGAPKLFNSDFFLEKHVFIGTVARFFRNKSLLISFGAPVLTSSAKMILYSLVDGCRLI